MKELYDKLSNELHHDGLIHKDELAWALFKAHRHNLFVDRVFELFDMKQNNVIEFGEFVRSLSVFHPSATLEEKAECRLHTNPLCPSTHATCIIDTLIDLA